MHKDDHQPCDVIRLLDLTNLSEGCDAAAIEKLCARASTRFCDVAAICVYPQWVRSVSLRRPTELIRIASVVNFPQGGTDAEAAGAEAERAFADGAEEIDVVLPWRSFLAGDFAVASAVLRACKARVPRGGKMKVILETGELKLPDAIAEASRLALDHGADFLKTSTGKVAVNATPEAARIMLEVIRKSGRPAGFKASGGIGTLAQALPYLKIAREILGPNWITPETFRFGASSLLDNLLAQAGATASGY